MKPFSNELTRNAQASRERSVRLVRSGTAPFAGSSLSNCSNSEELPIPSETLLPFASRQVHGTEEICTLELLRDSVASHLSRRNRGRSTSTEKSSEIGSVDCMTSRACSPLLYFRFQSNAAGYLFCHCTATSHPVFLFARIHFVPILLMTLISRDSKINARD